MNEISTLKLEDIIDIYNAPKIKASIDNLISQNKTLVIINLEKVPYIDSSGIGVLLSSMRDLKKKGGDLKITGLCASVKKILEMSNLLSVFKIYSTEEEAADSFNELKPQ